MRKLDLKFNKILCILLTISMLFSIFPTYVLAEEIIDTFSESNISTFVYDENGNLIENPSSIYEISNDSSIYDVSDDTEIICMCGTTDNIHSENCPLYEESIVNECTCESEIHDIGCPLYIESTIDICTCNQEVHTIDCPLYEAPVNECTCGAEAEIHLSDCPLYKEDEQTSCNCNTADDTHLDTCPLYVVKNDIDNQCICDSIENGHNVDCPLYSEPVVECICNTTDNIHSELCPLYEKVSECICGEDVDIHLEDCPLYEKIETTVWNFTSLMELSSLLELYNAVLEDTSVIKEFSDTEKESFINRINELYELILEPNETDFQMKEELLSLFNDDVVQRCEVCGLENGHKSDCEYYVCSECGFKEHIPDCSQYSSIQNQLVCEECGSKDGIHLETCSFYICSECNSHEHLETCSHFKIVCKECGEEDNKHKETCSLYIDNRTLYEKILDSDLDEIYEFVTSKENLEDLNNLSEEEIDEIIYYVGLIADDEDLEIEVLTLLYELPNAPECPWKTLETDYIYFDLYYGNISITGTTYSGYDSNGQVVSGEHKAENQYYIYQSVGTSTVWEDGLPVYDRVSYDGEFWGEFITDHPSKSTTGAKSVDEVITAWGSVSHKASTVTSGAAFESGRIPTPNYVKIQGTGTFNVIIDDLWSSYQVKYSTSQQNASSFKNDLGGFVFVPEGTNNLLNLYLVGDNRFGNIHCATHDGTNGKYTVDTNHTNTITVQTLSGENDATLTLCNILANTDTNSTASCIGGTDGRDHSVKMIFNSGIIYAGSAYKDFCTPIGGGGNGDGRVTINGGIITAVNSSTGAAIGGGCGTSGAGGYGEVNITGGEVYAYSYAVYYNSSSYYNNALATAIGGGSSGTQIGGIGIVDISGGYVYAYSEKGNAIGGGGGGYGLSKSSDTTYDSATGGIADVTISGGIIHAISDSGCAIGGGPGGGRSYDSYYTKNGVLPDDALNSNSTKVKANGGSATLTITGGTIYTGSIGGGSPQFHNGTDKNKYGFTIGAAEVYISGGETHGQVVMEGAGSAFEMTRGIIDNTPIGEEYHFVKNDGGAVYIKTGNAIVRGGTIENCSADNGGAIYIDGGDFVMTGGIITNCEATDGGAIYVKGGNIDIYDGTVDGNTASNNGGAIYATSDTNDILINVFDGQITNNTAGNHAGAIGASVDGTLKITINIGEEECLGVNTTIHDDHNCPIIKNNSSSIFGGAFCLHGNSEGLLVNVYCGEVYANSALRYPGSNTISQEGGKFAIYGGIIDPGVMVGGGIFEDNRIDAKIIKVRFWGNYEGAPTEPIIIECTLGVTLNFPANTYVNGNHELSGWTNVPNSQEGWVPVGGQYAVYDDGDDYLDYYAVWDATVSYIVYIPDTWDIDSNGTGEMDISAELNYFKKDSRLEIIVNSDFKLTNVDDANDVLYYELRTNEPGINDVLLDGDVVAWFQYNNTDTKTLTANILRTIINAGTYEGLLTFTVTYSE